MENLDTDVIVERFNSMTILRLSCLLIDSGDKQFFFFSQHRRVLHRRLIRIF